MSVNLTSALQNIGGRDPNFVDVGPDGPVASRQNGLVLKDSETVSFSSPGPLYNTITATATGSSPSGAENLVLATPNGTSGTATLRALVPGDLPLATNASAGVVEPDNTTITISGGVISASAPASGMSLIQKQTVATTTASVTFSDIPQTFTNLMLVISGIGDANPPIVFMQFNGDTGANYGYNILQGSNGAASSTFNAPSSSILLGNLGNAFFQHGNGMIESMVGNYTSAGLATVVQSKSTNIEFSQDFTSTQTGGIWQGLAAVTSITLAPGSGNFTNAVFSLYGMA